MFILIPCILIVISLVSMAVIIRRKLPYLRKLSPDAHVVSEHLFADFFPELVGWFNGIPWRESRQTSLREIEKFLRRGRLVLLKVDHISDRLIKKVRRIHLTTHLKHTAEQAEKAAEDTEKVGPVIPVQPTLEDLHAREQQLIIEIAQDPKNAGLYETLGDLYVKIESIEDAKEAYEAALGFNPDNETLARKYSELLKKTDTVA